MNHLFHISVYLKRQILLKFT